MPHFTSLLLRYYIYQCKKILLCIRVMCCALTQVQILCSGWWRTWLSRILVRMKRDEFNSSHSFIYSLQTENVDTLQGSIYLLRNRVSVEYEVLSGHICAAMSRNMREVVWTNTLAGFLLHICCFSDLTRGAGGGRAVFIAGTAAPTAWTLSQWWSHLWYILSQTASGLKPIVEKTTRRIYWPSKYIMKTSEMSVAVSDTEPQTLVPDDTWSTQLLTYVNFFSIITSIPYSCSIRTNIPQQCRDLLI